MSSGSSLDLRRVVDEIRAYLGSADQTDDADVRQLAEAYAASCRTVNDRLRKCDELMGQGLLSQAIEIADEAPNLLDQVALLDFAEREAWESAAAGYGWKRGFGPMIAVAENVNRAYQLAGKLRPLLERHRRLALSLALVKERLEAMRAIAAVDTISPIWDGDIKEFEKVRLKEVATEVEEVLRGNDLARMKALAEECEQAPWRVRPAKALASRMDALIARAAREVDVPRIARDLCAAEAAGDIGRGRLARAAWEAAGRRAASDRPDWRPEGFQKDRLEAALRWLSDEDVREAKDRAWEEGVVQLKGLLDRADPPLFEIVRRVRMLERQFRRSLPETIEAKYGRFRRNYLIVVVGAGLAFATVLAFLSYFAILSYAH